MVFKEFFQALFAEIDGLLAEFQMDGPMDRMGRQLRIMYGRGEIDQAVFFRLRGMLEKGYTIEGELKSLHRQALYRQESEEQHLLSPPNTEIARGLDFVHYNRARLEEVRSGLRMLLRTLESEQAWTAQQAAEFYEQAQAALPDENEARAYLEIRQDLLDRQQNIDRRVKALREDQRRIIRLDGQLRFYESELRVAQARELLASEEVTIKRKLLSE